MLISSFREKIGRPAIGDRVDHTKPFWSVLTSDISRYFSSEPRLVCERYLMRLRLTLSYGETTKLAWETPSWRSEIQLFRQIYSEHCLQSSLGIARESVQIVWLDLNTIYCYYFYNWKLNSFSCNLLQARWKHVKLRVARRFFSLCVMLSASIVLLLSN